ncbi:MAG: hypothetical protein MPJ50_17410 [Pirellulales bacterium]|nr:hypothetical protein [Pirellulales bacterium]
MKKLGLFAVLLSVGMFVGCGGEEAKKDAGATGAAGGGSGAAGGTGDAGGADAGDGAAK